MTDTTSAGLVIRGFADAAMTAFALHEEFGFCHAGACLDDLGNVRDMTMFTDPGTHTVESALDWAFCWTMNDDHFTHLVVFSTGSEPVADPSEGDLALFRLMRSAFGRHGIEVLDWIRCDGENVRSLAFTERSDAWNGAAAAPEHPPDI